LTSVVHVVNLYPSSPTKKPNDLLQRVLLAIDKGGRLTGDIGSTFFGFFERKRRRKKIYKQTTAAIATKLILRLMAAKPDSCG
jgi:hypothetical protein